MMPILAGCSLLFDPADPADGDDPTSPDAALDGDGSVIGGEDGGPLGEDAASASPCDPFVSSSCGNGAVCQPAFVTSGDHKCVAEASPAGECSVSQTGGGGCDDGLYGYTANQGVDPWLCLPLCDAAHPCAAGTCLTETVDSNGVGVCEGACS